MAWTGVGETALCSAECVHIYAGDSYRYTRYYSLLLNFKYLVCTSTTDDGPAVQRAFDIAAPAQLKCTDHLRLFNAMF